MNYYLDTEFIEGFHTMPGLPLRTRHHIELISIALIREDGYQTYQISSEYDFNEANPWVIENVIKPMYKETPQEVQDRYGWGVFHKYYGKTHGQIVDALVDVVYGDPNPVFYGYYADYDWVVFCSLFGTMMDLPKGFPMYCRDLKQLMDHYQLSNEWKQANCPDPEGEHNALVDAEWNRRLHRAIEHRVGADRF